MDVTWPCRRPHCIHPLSHMFSMENPSSSIHIPYLLPSSWSQAKGTVSRDWFSRMRSSTSISPSSENNRDFFFSRETHKNYCNWFDNSEIIRSLSYGFSFQRERVFHVNFVFLCVIVFFFFGLLIFVIILFGTQHGLDTNFFFLITFYHPKL